jgi:hypothetical protein
MCTSMIQYQCMVPSDCATGQVCCGGLGGDAGALLAALGDAGLDGGFDAAGLLAGGDAGAGGLGGLLGGLAGLTIESFCQTSCMPGQYQLCASGTDCSNAGANSVCGMAPAGALGGGGAGLGALLGGAGGGAGGGLLTLMTCQPPDAGVSTSPEAGSDAGSTTDGGASDSSSASEGGGDSGGTTDAATDSPTE